MRCPACASLRTSSLYKIHPGRYALAGLTGLVAGAIVGAVLEYGLNTAFFYAILFVGPFAGRYVGDGIILAVGRKRGLALEILTGITIVLGAACIEFFWGDWPELISQPIEGIVYAVALCLTAGAAIARIRLQ